MENLQLNYKIRQQLTYWRMFTELSSSSQYNDVNKTNEDLSCQVLNEIFEWNLINLNTIKPNFPAIDLGDDKKGIGISVTATDDSKYIKEKIKINIKHKIYQTYPTHFFLITTSKKKYTAEFDTKGFYTFDKSKNILDIQDLFDEIEKQSYNKEKQKKILSILENNVYKLKGNFIEDITPHDIAKVLEEFSSQNPDLIKNISVSIQSIHRTDFPQKNRINNLSEGYIKLIQQESLPFFEQVAKFLEKFENRNFKKIYYNITTDLQKTILVKRADFEEFDQIFETIGNICKEQVPQLLAERRTLQILLHFMYFQCDIGENKP
ncbi:MAG: hypothetical protein EAY75_12630 [Bacteroidetes bacterium]|nr:MAG: hypothetical protein EAY75_12630 [Bacteroidota bacterium]